MQRGELQSGIDDVPEVDNGDGAAVQAYDVSEVDKGDSVAVQAQGSQPPEPSGRRRCRHRRAVGDVQQGAEPEPAAGTRACSGRRRRGAPRRCAVGLESTAWSRSCSIKDSW